jgi:hypothetical protein
VFTVVGFGQSAGNPPESIQAIPPTDVDNAIAGTVNFEGTVTAGVTDLVTSVAPTVMTFGWTLLGLFGVFALLQSLQHAAAIQAKSHFHNPLIMIVAYVAVLFRVVVATTMMSFYLVPMPGMTINFHQLFPYLSNALSNAITTDLLRQVLTDFSNVAQYMPPVGYLQVLPAMLTVLVLVLIALGQVGMTIITAGSYAILGVLTLCGPLMIPFYVLPGHDKKFWNWFDNMCAYSMYGFIGTGFIYIFCHSYLDFFSNLHGYTVGQWLVSVPYLILVTVVFLWSMFKVPEITHIVFGGIGSVGQSFAGALQSLVVTGVAKAMV